MFLRRFLANIVDMIVVLLIMGVSVTFLASFFNNIFGQFIGALATFIAFIGAVFLVQYSFMIVGQTVGKSFFGLVITSTIEERPISPSIIIQRELFTKVMPLYLMCLPMFLGKPGQHDIMSATQVVLK